MANTPPLREGDGSDDGDYKPILHSAALADATDVGQKKPHLSWSEQWRGHRLGSRS
jgi:hypothetical protein